MKLSGFLNKPRWQAKEAALRRAGVAEDDDAELLAGLAGIARSDPDAGVRSAALKRLADPALTQRIAHEDTDSGVRTDARKLWFELLAGTHPRSPAPRECERLLRAQDDAALIEHIARNATDDGLRGTALARVTRIALLAERVTADPAPDLRLAALERIDDEALLERLAERTRKSDKRISRRARERVDALRIARGDSGVTDTVARSLCERLEKLVREPQSVEVKAEIDAQWAAIETRASESLRVRYKAAHALLVAARNGSQTARGDASNAGADISDTTRKEKAANEPATVSQPPSDSTAAPAASSEPSQAPQPTDSETPASLEAAEPSESSTPTPIIQRSVDPLLAQARFAASLNAANVEKQQQAQEQRQAATARAESVVATFEKAVEEGVAARAHTAHAEIATLRKESAGAFTRALQRRVTEAERRYGELSQWQHWSDNQRRRQLCETIEALAGSGLHPDAIATRVREAQAEWSRLDAAEGHAAHGAIHGWARRFHAACRHALEPAKSYFRKRQELRKTHAQAVSASIEQANAIPADCADWALITRTRHAVVDALRTLDRIDPRERKVLAKNLKAALSAIDARLSAHFGEIERAKSALIAEAQALAADESNRNAASAGRALQQRWRDVGNGRRDRDQAQWKVFRTALDAVFGKLDAERSQRAARDAESLVRAQALCAELEQLSNSDERPQRAVVARIEGEWDTLRVRDESLQRRFRSAQSALRDAGMRHERASRRAPYEAWLARYALCRAAEDSAETDEDLRAAWDSAPHAEIAAGALATRFESALRNRSDIAQALAGVDVDALREVLIRLEIFAGLDSPREDHDRRRKLQVERLSARMRGGSAMTPHQELGELLTRWTEIAPTPSELDERLRQDLAAATETLP